ncbi:uncharacterized [Tachysurus ichikawai]
MPCVAFTSRFTSNCTFYSIGLIRTETPTQSNTNRTRHVRDDSNGNNERLTAGIPPTRKKFFISPEDEQLVI